MKDLFIRYLLSTIAGVVTTIGIQSYIVSPLAIPNGGPQGLEGYVKVAHDRGITRLAIGTIGNVENNARGETTEIRSLQAGGVVTNDGHVDRWSGLYVSKPTTGNGYTGSVNIDEYDYIRFDNGWTIRPDGERLLLCSPKDVCRSF